MNILLAIPEDIVEATEDLLTTLRKRGGGPSAELIAKFKYTPTEQETAEATALFHGGDIRAVNQYYAQLHRARRNEYKVKVRREHKNWTSRRQLMVALLELGLKHAGEL